MVVSARVSELTCEVLAIEARFEVRRDLLPFFVLEEPVGPRGHHFVGQALHVVDLRPTPTPNATMSSPPPSDRASFPRTEAHRAELDRRIRELRESRVLREAFVEDVKLAYACSLGDPEALATFQSSVVPRMRRSLHRFRLSDGTKEDLLQSSVVKILVGTSGSIVGYQGRASLASWACTITTRAALDETRRVVREVPIAENSTTGSGWQIVAPPEFAHIADVWSISMKLAIEQALSELSLEDRAVLRMHFVEGRTLDEVSRAFDVHPATVSRRLADLRRTLLTRTRDGMVGRLGVPDEDLPSVERACAVGVDLSLSRLLADDDDDPFAGLHEDSVCHG